MGPMAHKKDQRGGGVATFLFWLLVVSLLLTGLGEVYTTAGRNFAPPARVQVSQFTDRQWSELLGGYNKRTGGRLTTRDMAPFKDHVFQILKSVRGNPDDARTFYVKLQERGGQPFEVEIQR